MSAILTFIKSFWKIPEGKQFISACFVVIAVSWGLNGKQWIEIKALNIEMIKAEREKTDMQRQHGMEMVLMGQRCDSVADAREARARTEERERYRDMMAESNRQVDQALRTSDRILNAQTRVRHTVSAARKEVAK